MKDGSVRVFLFLMGLIGLSWPLIAIFKLSVVSYVFVSWPLLILLAFAVQRFCERGRPEGGKNPPSP